jgi:ATP-dependent RNA helicase RhlE
MYNLETLSTLNKSRNKPRYGKNSNSAENKAKNKKGFWGDKSNKKPKKN